MKKAKVFLLLSVLFFYSPIFGQAPTNGLKLYYSFETAPGDVVPDLSGNGYSGTLLNGATVGTSTDGKKVLILGSDGNDYLDMGSAVGGLVATLTNFSISAFVYVDAATNLGANGNFVAVFTNSDVQVQGPAGATGFCYLQAKRSRYAVSPSGWCCEEGAQDIGDIAKGKWVHMAYTQSGTQGILYIDGAQKGISTVTLTPSGLGSTPFNYIGRPCFSGDAYLMNAMISDFRIYNRALTTTEVLQTAGYPAELITQWQNLDLGDLSAVKTDLTLPLTLGSQGVSVSWVSSNTNYVKNDGKVTRPSQYDATVKLTATLKMTVGLKTDSVTKEFTATVVSTNPASELLAKWNFASSKISMHHDTIKVADESTSGFVGTLKNVAKIRTIGTSVKYNVLDLGNSNGYFDMDTVIGTALYALGNYTVGAYFRVDSTNTTLNNNGNFLWNFSNSANIATDANGVMFGSLKIQGNRISKLHWSGEQGVSLGTNAPKGKWHHMAYSQNGTTGTLFIDGVSVLTGTVTHLPSTALPLAGRTGTRYNWLGRPGYSTDSYLQKTLVYGFELYGVPLTQDDLLESLDVDGVVASLNTAYIENSDVILPELNIEKNNLSLGDLSAVTANITLPLSGTLDPLITISWSSSNPLLVSAGGVINRNDYLNTSAVLTATLSKGGQKVTKDFTATIMAKPGTEFASDLLLNYNFASNLVSGTTVTDAAEKQFTGALKKGATVVTIGPAGNQHNLLNLGTDSAYFDMGTECGKVIYGLNDYSVSVYFLIDRNKANFSNNGNFIYTFSNSDSANTKRNGYMFGRATRALHCVSSEYWGSGNMQTADASSETSKGLFHHFVYTQNGMVGTAYIDGKVVSSVAAFTNIPSTALTKPGLTGTLYNWLGRPNYVGDTYLSKALLADFQLYKKALSDADISAMQVKRSNLNLAYIHDSIPELLSEKNNLDLGDLSALVSDIILPANGAFDPSVVITWTSSFPGAITTSGTVTRPDFLDAKVLLTATLTKNGQTLTREFPATVLAKTGSGFASDLLLNYNFASSLVSGTTVTDAAEKHFTGTLMKGASVSTIGTGSGAYNVLNLASDSAYFDMGVDCGKLIYGLSDYSISVYFAIDQNKTNFSSKGNIIYNFSNSDSSSLKKNGYLFGRATNATHCVSPNAESGNMLTAAATSEVSKGTFHHLVFTQKGNTGTTYLDGDTVSSVTSFTNIPNMALPKEGLMGTPYNWLGRSSYQGDAYLANATIADFKLYKKVLTGVEVKTMQDEKASLDAAYKGTSAVARVDADQLNINTSMPGLIQINGLTGKEKVSVFDILGRSIAVKDIHLISVRSGIYIVKVDSRVVKVFVK